MNPRLATGNFYGQTLRQHEAGGFSLSETRYLPRTGLPPHSHESHYFCFVLGGSYRETYDRKVRFCEPLMILYHPAGELHAQTFDTTPVDLFRIEVDLARLKYPNHPTLSLTAHDFHAGPHVGLAYKLYREFREPDAVSHLAIEGLCLELIALLARDSGQRGKTLRQQPRWLREAHELVKSRYLEQLTLTNIAGSVGVHPVTLAREFQHYYDCTVGQMVRRERITFACRELLTHGTSVAEIATAAGFYDQSHFARTFKRLTGWTPAQYRSLCRTR